MNDDIKYLYATLSLRDRATVDATIQELFLSQVRAQTGKQNRAAPSVTSTESGKAENVLRGR